MASKNQAVTYTYNTTHGLIKYTDSLGHTPIRVDYDASGRKTDEVDAFGNVIHFGYNLAANSQSVTDQSGNPAVNVYDNHGNVVQRTEYLNGVPQVSSFTYDQYDNKISAMLPGHSAPDTFIFADPNNPRLVTTQIKSYGNLNLKTTFTYDAQGHIVTETDPNQNVQTNTYDIHGNLSTSQAAQDVPPAVYSYDANGNKVKVVDANGCETDYTYDASGNELSETTGVGSPNPATTTYTYDANGNKQTATQTSSAGNFTTLFQYDGDGNNAETIYPDGSTSQTTYDSLGHVVGTQDQDQRNISNFFDAMGHITTVQYNVDNTKQTTLYDANGRPATVTDRGGRTTITLYDSLSHPATMLLPDGTQSVQVSDAQGRVTDTTDPSGNHVHMTYDDAGRKLSEITGYGTSNTREADYAYDANGNVKTVSVNGRLQATNSYDSRNHLIRVDYPDGTHTLTSYDNDGRKTSFTDQAGKRTEYSYDCQGKLTEVRQITSGGTLRTDYTVDQVGNITAQTDADSHTTSYSWNNMNRRTGRQLPDGRSESYTQYDGIGNLLQKRDFAGNQFTYGYDGSNHLTSVSGPGATLGYTYDNAQYRVVMNDASGATTFHHDERNRMTAKISPLGTLTFTNNLTTGQEASVVSTNTNGTNITYQYDSQNRAATVLDGTLTTLLNYDPVGNFSGVVLPNGVAVTLSYNSVNQLTDILAQGNSLTQGSYHYTLGAAGNRTGASELNGRQITYTPDDLYRLVGEMIQNDPVAANNGMVGYTYDNVGNRQQRTSSVTPIGMQNFTGAYDPADELKPTFSFDQNGNQTGDARGFTYTYNTLNQLTRVQGSGVDVSYIYDGDGLRVQKTNNLTGVVTSYLWDDDNITGNPQVVEELQNGQVVRRYTYGPQGALYVTQLLNNSWVTSYLGRDGEGSVRFLMDQNGNVTDTFTYDGFGNLLSRTGSTPMPLGFQGEYVEPETGLVYLRARWYNADEGRFMEMDAFEGNREDPRTLHHYTGFNDDPANVTDPTGNQGTYAEASITVGAVDNLATQALIRYNARRAILSAVAVMDIALARTNTKWFYHYTNRAATTLIEITQTLLPGGDDQVFLTDSDFNNTAQVIDGLALTHYVDWGLLPNGKIRFLANPVADVIFGPFEIGEKTAENGVRLSGNADEYYTFLPLFLPGRNADISFIP